MKAASIVWIATLGCLLAAACGDDSGSGQPSGAAAGGGDAGSQEAVLCAGELEPDLSGATELTYLCDANPSSDPEAKNACRNESDCSIIDTDMVRELAKQCGLSSRGNSDCDVLRSFNQECVVMQTDVQISAPGLSPDCANCYAEVVVCGLDFCLSECAADADAPQCVDCQLKNGCRLPFEACSGLERL